MQKTLAPLALTLWAVAAVAQSSVAGSPTVAGKATPLTQVYAWRSEGFFDKKKDDTVVLLADRSVAAAGFALGRLAAEGKLWSTRAAFRNRSTTQSTNTSRRSTPQCSRRNSRAATFATGQTGGHY